VTGHTASFLAWVARCAMEIDQRGIEDMVQCLRLLRQKGGRLFVVGVGGGAANAAHAVNDLRKIAGLEAYSPWDSPSELTAWTNDDAWANSIKRWLQSSRMTSHDAMLVFSVTGGDTGLDGRSPSIRTAVEYALEIGAAILGVVGSPTGTTALCGRHVVVVSGYEEHLQSALTESFQCVLIHLLVSHPDLRLSEADRQHLWS